MRQKHNTQKKQQMGPNSSPLIAPSTSTNINDNVGNYWRHFDSSVNAISFGFVATAILISMFLVMAIFERFLRQGSGGRNGGDIEASNWKLTYPSPKITTYANGVSVLMPGDKMPSFIAQHAPCAPERSSSSVT